VHQLLVFFERLKVRLLVVLMLLVLGSERRQRSAEAAVDVVCAELGSATPAIHIDSVIECLRESKRP
jgi:hypothetical protein